MCASAQRHRRRRDAPADLSIRVFSAGSVRRNDKERGDSDSAPQSSRLTAGRPLLAGRRRPLSPLERLSGLLPPDALSPEVMQLREQEPQEAEEGASIQGSATGEMSGHPETLTGDPEMRTRGQELDHHPGSDAAVDPNPSGRLTPAALPGERSLTYGEFLVAEYYKKQQIEFRKMFKLQTKTRLQSSWGVIPHDSIAGQPAGQVLKTNLGVPILIRRPSLEDYVLFMRRSPAIAYPKDVATMLMMMDVTAGDSVLESGSGSGAMSLFLSRAVGSEGRVLSVEVRQDHLRRAMSNYKSWRTSWSLRRGQEWPDNVEFHNADLCRASSLLAGQGFHAIALDLTNPHLVLPTVTPHLHSGAVCAIYLANITQVVDLLEGIRCAALPLLCERIIEVPIRHWLVAPAMQKDGQYCNRKAPVLGEEEEEVEDQEVEEGADQTNSEGWTADEGPAFGSIPYIARPHPLQLNHTAFLVKLRKYGQ